MALQTGDGNYNLKVVGTGIQDDGGTQGNNSISTSWTIDNLAPTKPTNLVFTLTGDVLSISGELPESGLRVYVSDQTDRKSLGELAVTGVNFSGEIQLPNSDDRIISIQVVDAANNLINSLFKISGGAIER